MRVKMRMNKLITGIVMAAFLTFAIAGQAAAEFIQPGQLLQTIYEGTTDAGYEFHTDAGDVMNLANRTVYTDQPAEDLSDFSVLKWEDLYTGFVSQSSWKEKVGPMPFHWDTTRDAFFATTTDALPHASDMLNIGQYLVFQANVSGLMGGITVSGEKTEKSYPTSYWELIEWLPGSMDNAQGVFSGFMNYEYKEYGFANLGALGHDPDGDGIDEPLPGSYVDMLLWQYHDYDGFFNPDHEGLVNINGEYEDTYVANLRIGIDGEGNLYTTTNPVPIPGAVWLFGSGLLALVGIRRRKSA